MLFPSSSEIHILRIKYNYYGLQNAFRQRLSDRARTPKRRLTKYGNNV